MTKRTHRKPRPLFDSADKVLAEIDPDGDVALGQYFDHEGDPTVASWFETPKDVQRLIDWLTKAKLWKEEREQTRTEEQESNAT